jgi:IS5 family transposase
MPRVFEAVADEKGRIRRFELSGGNRHGAAVAEPLILSGDNAADFFIGDKGYDSQDLRAAAEDAGHDAGHPVARRRALVLIEDENVGGDGERAVETAERIEGDLEGAAFVALDLGGVDA